MPVPRHALRHGRGVTWRRPSPLTADVARLCRATDLGTAVPRPDLWRGRARYNRRRCLLPEQSAFHEKRSKAVPPRPPSPVPAHSRGRRHRGNVRPCQLARPRQQASRGSKRAAPARPPAARCSHRARTQARLPLRPEPPVTQGGCPPRPAPAPLGPVLRAATRYSTNIVSTVNKVSKIIKV